MARFTWTNQELEILKKKYSSTPTWKMNEFIPAKGIAAIKTKATILGLRKNKGLPSSRIWNDFTDNELRDLYPNHSAIQIAKIMDLTVYQIKNRARKLGLHKENFTIFKKGHIPANKGKKMDDKLKKRLAHTFFKKGDLPATTSEIGTISLTEDGYYRVKIANPNKWDYLHRMIWKEHHKEPIKRSEIIIFKDGNKNNIIIDNLEKISRKEHIDRMRDTDKHIAWMMSHDKELQQELLKNSEIIELKRNLLKLNKQIKNGRESKNKAAKADDRS